MAVLDNIITALREWKVWQRIEATPERLDKLEARLTELESKLKRAPGEACPSCGALEFRVTKSETDQVFGILGGSRRYMKCNECGFAEDKIVS